MEVHDVVYFFLRQPIDDFIAFLEREAMGILERTFRMPIPEGTSIRKAKNGGGLFGHVKS